ncbi:integrase core domain-containing protein, partial [Stutzerimonas stutzeri]|uniref:integrase core domain-containing protein n=1 Tax=Stutzerimonas stutzeri TaxID=316 RepID=UPI0025527C07
VALMFQYQSNRSLADFRGVLRRRLHGSILSRVGASGKAGAVHTVRYDWLGHYLFESIAEVQEHATRWIWTYNHERPNMALGGIT